MDYVPCEDRRFPLALPALVSRVEATYAFWMKHLVERLGASARRQLWGEAFARYDRELLEQVLASGWSEAGQPGTADEPPLLSLILGEYLGAGTDGMEASEAQSLIGETPPLPEFRRSFAELDVQRETTAYEALHLYAHGLALLSESLIDRYGKQGELIAYDVLSSGRSALGRRMGGSVAGFMRESEEVFHEPGIYSAGLDVESISVSPTEHVSRVKRCEWARYFRERHPRVGYLVACSTDEAFGRGYNESLRLQRTSTLMEGGSECDFRWYSLGETPGETPGETEESVAT
ncbi:MAG: L-2-amino-thiazoline-4-carboxylic acid hydrolase [Candidatus Eisenbacteria sp.]|nr:L-2-amino-thiazoline-4-carboxylic acid hydrolase [Candidatus Eisenbacteria bacterium]